MLTQAPWHRLRQCVFSIRVMRPVFLYMNLRLIRNSLGHPDPVHRVRLWASGLTGFELPYSSSSTAAAPAPTSSPVGLHGPELSFTFSSAFNTSVCLNPLVTFSDTIGVVTETFGKGAGTVGSFPQHFNFLSSTLIPNLQLFLISASL